MLTQNENSIINDYIDQLGKAAKQATQKIAKATTKQKNQALLAIARNIEMAQQQIVAANQKDIEAGIAKQLDSALLDRLELTPERITGMINGLQQIVGLPDPIGEISKMNYQPSGIKVGKMRVPLGVIGIIYESRPNVTIDAAALCLKSGNAAILRGGSEAFHSNQALSACINKGLTHAGLPQATIQVVDTTSRDAVGRLLKANKYVDVIIPRGGRNLIQRVSQQSNIPVIKHLEGNCHVYIDAEADKVKAISVAYNAKARRYGICGAMETLLVAEPIATLVLPELIDKYQAKGIELRGCEKTLKFNNAIKAATQEDWYTEFLGPTLAVAIVDDLTQAIAHIEEYGSHHTDSIVTENISHANRFMIEVDSSSVMVNASTQFADGFEYGLGAEIGISTNKLHVRGPVGLEGLTTQKYIVIGDGHARV